MSRLCFDIETEPFSAAFLEAKSRSEKLRAAPTMRIACVYSEDDRKYRFYTAEQAPALIAVLLAASEVISFNGKAFDVLVLRRHYGLIGTLPRRGKHTDLHELLTERAGFRVSLNSAVALNFDEKKHTSGREMAKVNGTELRKACKSDVSQTYRLWALHKNGSLLAPVRRPFPQGGGDWMGGPGSFMPDICPICQDVGSLEFVDWSDDDDVTDGQLAEYIAGTQGSAFCTTCRSVLNWNV